MAFADASRWVRTNFFLNVLSLFLDVYISGGLLYGGRSVVPTMYATAGLLLLTVCLSFTWAFIDEAKDNKGVHISTLVFGFLTAILSLVTCVLVGLHGTSLTFIFFSAFATFFVLMAAIFACIEVSGEVTVKIPKIPSPRKAKKAKAEKDAEAGEGEKKEEAVELEEAAKEDKKDEAEDKEEQKKEEGATNGQVVKEEEGAKAEEKKEEEAEKKEDGEQKAEEEKKE